MTEQKARGKYQKHPKRYILKVIGDLTCPPQQPSANAPNRDQKRWMRAVTVLWPDVRFELESHTPSGDTYVVRKLKTV